MLAVLTFKLQSINEISLFICSVCLVWFHVAPKLKVKRRFQHSEIVEDLIVRPCEYLMYEYPRRTTGV